jgi:hypothetical protein
MVEAFTAVMFVRRRQIDAGPGTMRSLGTSFAINLMFGLIQTITDLSVHLGGSRSDSWGPSSLAKTASPSARPLYQALFGGLQVER